MKPGKSETDSPIRLDLNNPVFQRRFFNLTKTDQRHIIYTFRKLSDMAWVQVYADHGLKREAILSQKGPRGVGCILSGSARGLGPSVIVIVHG